MKKFSLLCFLTFALAASAFAQTYKMVYAVHKNQPFANPWAGLTIVGSKGYSSTPLYGTYQATPTPGSIHSYPSQCAPNQDCFSYASLATNGKGQFFGVTPVPANAQGMPAGAVFMVDTTVRGWPTMILYSFTGGADGGIYGYPTNEANLIFDGAGNLWGTAFSGGNLDCNLGGSASPYCGVVFELVNNGDGTWTEQVIHSFSGPDGAGPAGALAFYNGNFYGTTEFGGDLNCAATPGIGCGTLFELTPDQKGGWTETVLHNFEDDAADGGLPLAGVTIDAQGDIFGTTLQGVATGENPGGTVYELSAKGLYSILQGDVGEPAAQLVFDKKGNLWGTASYGQSQQTLCGDVFELVNAQVFQVVHTFTGTNINMPDGCTPIGALALDGNGNLWGTTPYGGFGVGTFYEVIP